MTREALFYEAFTGSEWRAILAAANSCLTGATLPKEHLDAIANVQLKLSAKGWNRQSKEQVSA